MSTAFAAGEGSFSSHLHLGTFLDPFLELKSTLDPKVQITIQITITSFFEPSVFVFSWIGSSFCQDISLPRPLEWRTEGHQGEKVAKFLPNPEPNWGPKLGIPDGPKCWDFLQDHETCLTSEQTSIKSS